MQDQGLEQREGLYQAYSAFGMLDEAMTLNTFSEVVLPAVDPMLGWMVEPLRHTVFDFAQLKSAPMPSEKDQKVLARYLTGIADELPSFDRAWIGTLHLLRQIGARVRTADRFTGQRSNDAANP